MNKTTLLVLLLFNYVLNQTTYNDAEAHALILNDENSTIDGKTLSETAYNGVSILDGENIIHYEKEYAGTSGYGEATDESEMHSKDECNKEKLITISKAGIYLVSGSLKGQLAIELPETDNTQIVTLVLKGVDINCSVAPGLIFYNVYEIDSTEYEDSGTSISYSTANGLNFDNAGAKIIIADDYKNTVTGSHVAKCYKYTISDNGTISMTTKKRAKYDGAFYSKMSMSIKGETKGNGILNIIADNEGLDTEKHLLIESGNINIASQDDGINTNEDGGSVTLVKGGTLTINAGLGSEGDGIDSNGYLIINGGTVISAAKPQSDSGMDADLGVVVNGGTVIGVGSSMDGASTTSSQPTMNLQFSSQISKDSELIVKDSSGTTLLTFNPSSSGFVDDTDIRTYQGAILSHPSFKLNGVYYLFLGDTQLGYSGQGRQNTPGNPPDNEGGNNDDNRPSPPDNGGENNDDNRPSPPDNGGENNDDNRPSPPDNGGENNDDNRPSPPDNGGENNGSDNPGNPPDNIGPNNGQSFNTNSMSKEFTLTSTATTFNGVGVYSESSSTNDKDNSDKVDNTDKIEKNDNSDKSDNTDKSDNKDKDDNSDDNDDSDSSNDGDTNLGLATYIGISLGILFALLIPLFIRLLIF